MKTDQALADKVMQIYFRESYIMGDKYKNTQEDLDFINNNEFKVVVTEKTKNNGYDGDKQRVAEKLELNKPYVLESMDVGRSSSTIKLVDFPDHFNSVNFEFLPLDYDFLKHDYDKIVEKIQILIREKERIEKLMLERADNFVSKFRIWYNNEDEGHYDWVPDRHKFPLLRELMDNRDYRRGETIDLERILGDDVLYMVVDSYEENGYDTEEEYLNDLNEIIKEYQPLMEELMNKDLKSFKNDW